MKHDSFVNENSESLIGYHLPDDGSDVEVEAGISWSPPGAGDSRHAGGGDPADGHGDHCWHRGLRGSRDPGSCSVCPS